ncbi:GGDEF domain-containing protein [Undibacterium arcticum]
MPEDADLIFILIDLDDFKSVNDTYGHAAGDQVLEQMRERLETVFRESDYLIRWGGEEFLVVARAANRADAEAVSERVRAVVADRVFELADGLRLAKNLLDRIRLPAVPARPSAPADLGRGGGTGRQGPVSGQGWRPQCMGRILWHRAHPARRVVSVAAAECGTGHPRWHATARQQHGFDGEICRRQ